MSASLKHLFLETATIRSHDKHTCDGFFLLLGAEILIFFILKKVSAIPKHLDLLIKSHHNCCWLLVLFTSLITEFEFIILADPPDQGQIW